MGEFYEQPIVCISHNDMDGVMAAAVVKKRYGKGVRIIHSNYGRDLPGNAFAKGSKIIITDFSLQPQEFDKIRALGLANDLVWLDHHKANYEPLEQKGYCFAGLRKDTECGALLAWHFLFPNQPPPRAILLCDDYDRWVFKYPETKAFSAGFSMYETRPAYHSCYIYEGLLNDNPEIAEKTLKIVVGIGERLVKYNAERNKIMCNDLSYKVDWEGYKIMIANTKQANSMFFDSADKTGLDAVSVLQFTPDCCKYRCSVYDPGFGKVILPIVQKFPGGGGHPGAGGFQSAVYPFPVPTPVASPRSLADVIKDYQKILDMRKDVLVNQSACRSDKISLTSALFKTQFLGINCLAINHPYISELIRTFPSSVDLIDPADGSAYRMLIGFCMTKYGWYRTSCYFTDQSKLPSTEKFLDGVRKMHSEVNDIFVEDLGMLGKVYWFYSKTRPIGLPEKMFG